MTVNESLAGSAFVMFTAAARPLTLAEPLLPATLIASGPPVPLTITWSVWPSPAPEVDVDLADAGAGQVVLDDRVGAAERVQVDVLDAVDVHRDVADVAEEPEPAAVRRQVEVLVGVGAVEDHRVGAVLALDDVAAVARVPDEGVVARAQQGHVGCPGAR